MNKFLFKKIEVWILYLVILLSIVLMLAFGVLVRQEIEGTTKAKGIDISFLSRPAAEVARIPEKLLLLLANGNGLLLNSKLQESRSFFSQDGFKGDPNDYESYLLLSRFDGDLNEGIVELIDLRDFSILHTWNPDFNHMNSLLDKEGEFKYASRDGSDSRKRILHPKLLPGGDLVFNAGPLRFIDSCSKMIFQNTDDLFHHAIEADADENLWVSSRIYPQSLPEEMVGRDLPEDGGYWDDAITKLSPNGEILFQKSISKLFIENNMEYLLFSVGDMGFVTDPIHINDIQPIDFSSNFWKKGDILLSLRHQSMIVLYRPATNEIIKTLAGQFFHQHDVDVLDDSRIAIFNNNSKDYYEGDVVDKHNEVLIYDFSTDTYNSYLAESLSDNKVATVTEGRSEIVNGGDLFIEESNFGRTLYFNSDGSIRWTHVNKASNGGVYKLGWSRILSNKNDLDMINNFVKNKGKCNA